MFESHLASNAPDTDGNLGNDPEDWMVEAIQSTGGAVHNLIGTGIQEMTGAPISPLSPSQSAQIPGSTINQIPGQVPPYMLRSVNSNEMSTLPPSPPPSRPNKLLIYGGLGAVALVGYLWYTGKIGGRRKGRRR